MIVIYLWILQLPLFSLYVWQMLLPCNCSLFLTYKATQLRTKGNFPSQTGKSMHQCGALYLTIIPRGRVGYKVIDSQRGAKRRVGYNHLISNKREWNNCVIVKNHQQILLDFRADFAWLEQLESNQKAI